MILEYSNNLINPYGDTIMKNVTKSLLITSVASLILISTSLSVNAMGGMSATGQNNRGLSMNTRSSMNQSSNRTINSHSNQNATMQQSSKGDLRQHTGNTPNNSTMQQDTNQNLNGTMN